MMNKGDEQRKQSMYNWGVHEQGGESQGVKGRKFENKRGEWERLRENEQISDNEWEKGRAKEKDGRRRERGKGRKDRTRTEPFVCYQEVTGCVDVLATTVLCSQLSEHFLQSHAPNILIHKTWACKRLNHVKRLSEIEADMETAEGYT